MWFRQSTAVALFMMDVHHMEWYGKMLIVLCPTILYLQAAVAVLGVITTM